jgi:endonuclease YncB( thermonuclease family)
MHLPPYGLCLPCKLHHVRDGDTIVVTLPGGTREWAIRLIGCWAAELSDPLGQRAKAHAEMLLTNGDPLAVWIPAPENVANLLANLTFDRIPGHIFLGTENTLAERLIQAGLAWPTKIEQTRALAGQPKKEARR